MINLAIFFTLLALGYGFGRWAESSHYKRIYKREDALRSLIVIPEKIAPIQFQQHDCHMVTGNVVISVDYFKTVAAGLRGFFGGRIGAYESLLDRARREAVIRMQEEAQAMGAEAVYNLKFETARIGENAGKGLGSVEVLAYGSALIAPAQPKAINNQ